MFDFKKEFKEIYSAKKIPAIITVPKMNYVAVKGAGNPNDEGGAYQQAIQILYAISYALKMSYKTDYKIENFFEYVVPPLESFWWQENFKTVDLSHKEKFNWIAAIRLPDFITEKNFDWAKEISSKKKKINCDAAKFLTIEEGLCAQILHVGNFENEPETISIMEKFILDSGYENNFENELCHHEIYLNDARKVAKDKLKIIIRHPIKKI